MKKKKGLQKVTIFIGAILYLAVLFPHNSQAQISPLPAKPLGYVSDFAGVIRPADRMAIERLAAELEKKTTAQIAVVTVQSVKPETIEMYAVRLFEKWGIGQKGKDNGVLLLVAVKDRRVRIETGYGVEGIIPDAIADKIIRDILVPAFKQEDYSGGIKAGAIAIISLIAKDAGVTITGQEEAVYQQVGHQPSALESFLSFIFMVIFFILIIGTRTGLLWFFLLGPMGHRRGGYWYGSGFGGSRGGFGGGFGGFGGGLSGGGGASGGW